jgi:hypothetical protein
MIHVRLCQPEDGARLEALHHRMGFDYALPDLADPLVAVKVALEAQSGKIDMAILGRVTCEAYLLMDPEAGTPAERWQRLQILSHAAEARGRLAGFTDVQAFIPPAMERKFAKRLGALGFEKNLWPCWSKQLSEKK